MDQGPGNPPEHVDQSESPGLTRLQTVVVTLGYGFYDTDTVGLDTDRALDRSIEPSTEPGSPENRQAVAIQRDRAIHSGLLLPDAVCAGDRPLNSSTQQGPQSRSPEATVRSVIGYSHARPSCHLQAQSEQPARPAIDGSCRGREARWEHGRHRCRQ